MRTRNKIIIIHTLPAIIYSIAAICCFTVMGYRYAEAKKGDQISGMMVAFYKAEAAKARKEEYKTIIAAYDCVIEPVYAKPLPEIEAMK